MSARLVMVSLVSSSGDGVSGPSFILGDSNWNFIQVGYPVDTRTDVSPSVDGVPSQPVWLLCSMSACL